MRRGVVVLDVGEDGFGGEGSPLTPSPCSVSLWLGVIGRRPSSCCLCRSSPRRATGQSYLKQNLLLRSDGHYQSNSGFASKVG